MCKSRRCLLPCSLTSLSARNVEIDPGIKCIWEEMRREETYWEVSYVCVHPLSLLIGYCTWQKEHAAVKTASHQHRSRNPLAIVWQWFLPPGSSVSGLLVQRASIQITEIQAKTSSSVRWSLLSARLATRLSNLTQLNILANLYKKPSLFCSLYRLFTCMPLKPTQLWLVTSWTTNRQQIETRTLLLSDTWPKDSASVNRDYNNTTCVKLTGNAMQCTENHTHAFVFYYKGNNWIHF